MNATYVLKSRTTANTSMRIWLYSNIFDTLCAVFTAFAAQIPCQVHPKHRLLQWSMLVVRKNDKDTPILYLHLKLVNIFQNLKIKKSKNQKIKKSKIKKSKNQKIKKSKNQKIKKSKNTKIKKSKNQKIKKSKKSKNQKIKKSKNQKIQKSKNQKIKKYKNTKIQKIQKCKNTKTVFMLSRLGRRTVEYLISLSMMW